MHQKNRSRASWSRSDGSTPLFAMPRSQSPAPTTVLTSPSTATAISPRRSSESTADLTSLLWSAGSYALVCVRAFSGALAATRGGGGQLNDRANHLKIAVQTVFRASLQQAILEVRRHRCSSYRPCDRTNAVYHGAGSVQPLSQHRRCLFGKPGSVKDLFCECRIDVGADQSLIGESQKLVFFLANGNPLVRQSTQFHDVPE